MLIFNDCKIILTEEFKINDKLKYDISCLNLYLSLRKEDEEYMNSQTFPQFLKAIKDTQLGSSIVELQVAKDDSVYPNKSIEQMLSIYGFDIKVVGSNDSPNWED